MTSHAQLPKSSYPWLRVEEDGVLSAEMRDTTAAEMDRRLVIMQELRAGRLVLPEVTDEMVERVAEWFAGMRDEIDGPSTEPTDSDRAYAESALAAAFSTSSEETPDA